MPPKRRRFRTDWLAIFVATVGGLAAWCPAVRAQSDATAAPSAKTTSPMPMKRVIDLAARDRPYDDGRDMILTWPAMPFDDQPGTEYVVERSESEEGPFKQVLRFPADTRYTTDIKGPWWAWDKGDADDPPHFVIVSTPVRETVSVPLQEWPDGVDIPPALSELVSYNAQRRAMEASAPLTEAHRELLRGLSPDPVFQNAARKLSSIALSYDAGGKLGEPLTDVPYYFRVRAVQDDVARPWSETARAMPTPNWFKLPLLNNLIFVVVLSGILLFFLEFAKRRELFLRRIPGLSAVDEAIGRATEMGKAVFYMTGRLDMDNISTIAASTILGEVAKKTAAYGVELKVPHTFSVTMAVCREITRNAYIEAGRPDSYHDDINYYITEEQFSYAAAVNGQMLRERPGAVFYMGYYYAESLLMAEAGATTGAIQIAGTDAEAQLPFFVTTCDYTLIGEELFAASAYLSRKPELVGALRGQDLGKLIAMAVIILGSLLATAAVVHPFPTDWVMDFLGSY